MVDRDHRRFTHGASFSPDAVLFVLALAPMFVVFVEGRQPLGIKSIGIFDEPPQSLRIKLHTDPRVAPHGLGQIQILGQLDDRIKGG
jgi:hypothetical protein